AVTPRGKPEEGHRERPHAAAALPTTPLQREEGLFGAVRAVEHCLPRRMRSISHGAQLCCVVLSAACMCGSSCQHQFVGASHPLGKPLTVSSFRNIVASQPLHVVRQLLRCHLVSSELATEPGVQPEPAAKVDLVSLDLIAVRPDDKLAFQTDVCHLDPGTRVW